MTTVSERPAQLAEVVQLPTELARLAATVGTVCPACRSIITQYPDGYVCCTDHYCRQQSDTYRALACRELAWRYHDVEPPASQPIAHLEWVIEQQLSDAWDQQVSPYQLLATFTARQLYPARTELLDEVFAAAEAVHGRESGTSASRAPISDLISRYQDAIFSLAQSLRGVS